MKTWMLWLGAIAAYIVAPPLFSALLRPLARSCREDTTVPIILGFEFEFYECDFGWPQPFEFFAATFASGSRTMALFGFLALGMIGFIFYIIWVLRTN